MTDRHIRVLRMAARHRQRQLDHPAGADGRGDSASSERRQDLEQVTARARAQLAAAYARRRQLATT